MWETGTLCLTKLVPKKLPELWILRKISSSDRSLITFYLPIEHCLSMQVSVHEPRLGNILNRNYRPSIDRHLVLLLRQNDTFSMKNYFC